MILMDKDFDKATESSKFGFKFKEASYSIVIPFTYIVVETVHD